MIGRVMSYNTMHTRVIMLVCRYLGDNSRLLFADRLSLHKFYLSTMTGSDTPYVVDMRSDVLTKPTSRMLQAMTEASFDDDVFREDRTTLGK